MEEIFQIHPPCVFAGHGLLYGDEAILCAGR